MVFLSRIGLLVSLSCESYFRYVSDTLLEMHSATGIGRTLVSLDHYQLNKLFCLLVESVLSCGSPELNLYSPAWSSALCSTALRAQNIIMSLSPPFFRTATSLFFTLSGSSLHLDVLLRSLSVVLLMFFARLAGLMIGASFGSTFAGWRPRLRKYAWMGFVTQAGFSMGLAREAALEFPEHSETLLTFIVGVIVMNEVVGPPLFNYAIVQLGEDQGGSWEKEREEREREERKHDP
eukprot:Rmarinus@m.23023